MTNPNKARGTRHEVKIASSGNNFAATVGADLELYRPAQSGFRDTGDVHGARPFIIQAKAYANLADALRIGTAGAVKQAENAGVDYGVNVIKKPHGAIGDAYAVMRYQDFVRVLIRLRRAEALLSHAPAEIDDDHFERTVVELATDFPRA